MAKDSRFAVLIDADNVSVKYIKIILDEIAQSGVATYKRIYGDWTKPSLSSWKQTLLDNSILPCQQYGYTTGKNATDSAMIIDAMDILYSNQVDGFCLVSSDSDFTRLAARLRESGMTVVGMGEQKTPKAFIAACNQFKYLDVLAAAEEEQDKPEEEQDKPVRTEGGAKAARREGQTSLQTIRLALRAIVQQNSDEDDRMMIAKVGNLLGKRYPDFDVRNYGYSKFSRFLQSLEDFDVTFEGVGGKCVIYVQLK